MKHPLHTTVTLTVELATLFARGEQIPRTADGDALMEGDEGSENGLFSEAAAKQGKRSRKMQEATTKKEQGNLNAETDSDIDTPDEKRSKRESGG